MKIALISFTGEGAKTCRRIEAGLTSAGHECSAFGKDLFAGAAGILPLKTGLPEWTADAFRSNDALIFVGACGIAVRAIAPHVKDKTVDPAVVVVDEHGKYAISLLSGHLGGANELARSIAALLGAEPVITTATDLNGLFAVDDFAKQNGLLIDDLKLAREISAAILRGENVGVSCDLPVEGRMPEQLIPVEAPGDEPCSGDHAGSAGAYPRIGFRISIYEEKGPFEKTLRLIPRTVSVGIGCRKGISAEAVEELVDQVLKEHKILKQSIEKICSIDLKKEEVALRQLAEKLGVAFEVFSAEELNQLAGEFSSSKFVNDITGVNNVCERTAVLGSRGGLLVKKRALSGVTVAMAVRTDTIRFG